MRTVPIDEGTVERIAYFAVVVDYMVRVWIKRYYNEKQKILFFFEHKTRTTGSSTIQSNRHDSTEHKSVVKPRVYYSGGGEYEKKCWRVKHATLMWRNVSLRVQQHHKQRDVPEPSGGSAGGGGASTHSLVLLLLIATVVHLSRFTSHATVIIAFWRIVNMVCRRCQMMFWCIAAPLVQMATADSSLMALKTN